MSGNVDIERVVDALAAQECSLLSDGCKTICLDKTNTSSKKGAPWFLELHIANGNMVSIFSLHEAVPEEIRERVLQKMPRNISHKSNDYLEHLASLLAFEWSNAYISVTLGDRVALQGVLSTEHFQSIERFGTCKCPVVVRCKMPTYVSNFEKYYSLRSLISQEKIEQIRDLALGTRVNFREFL